MNYKKLNQIISLASKKSKYFEKDFFPQVRLKTKKGRFELLALSVLDVWGYDADDLWFIVGKELRKENILSIDFIEYAKINEIKQKLKSAGYNRGNIPLLKYSKILKSLARVIKNKYKGDISNMILDKKPHNQKVAIDIIKELDELPGVGQKIATMFLKFMISTFEIWKWNNKKSLIGISIPDDFQVRKVFIRLGNIPKTKLNSKKIMEEYASFSTNLKLSFMEIDDVLWNVGRIYCRKKSPSCHYCIFGNNCHYSELRRNGQLVQMKKIDNYIS